MATSRLCSIPDCGKPHYARSWCQNHWDRWWKHGDPLAGKTAHGEPLRYFRETVLANEGDNCLIWPFARNGHGYPHMVYDGRHQRIARLVCEHKHGPSPSTEHEAAHSCGNRSCVNSRHLRWATPIENAADKITHGTVTRGERHGMAKITNAIASQILSLKGTVRQRVIAKRFDVSQATVSNIHRGISWSDGDAPLKNCADNL